MIAENQVKKLITDSVKSGSEYLVVNGALQSVSPPTSLFGYTYWSHMIPPIKPNDMLMLGYGWGTVASLTKGIYGEDIRVTGVDLANLNNPECLQMNAYDYIDKHNPEPTWDYICIDLWDGPKSLSYTVNDKEFIEKIAAICKGFVCLNILLPESKEDHQEHIRMYENAGFIYDRNVVLYGNLVEWFSVGANT